MKKTFASVIVGLLFTIPTIPSLANDREGCDILGDYWYVQSNGVGVCSDQLDPCAGDAVSGELCISETFKDMTVDTEDITALAEAFCGGLDTYESKKLSSRNIIIKCKNGKPGNIKIKDSTSPRMGGYKDKMARFCQGLGSPTPSSKQCDGIDKEKCEWLDKLARPWGEGHTAEWENGTCMIYGE